MCKCNCWLWESSPNCPLTAPPPPPPLRHMQLGRGSTREKKYCTICRSCFWFWWSKLKAHVSAPYVLFSYTEIMANTTLELEAKENISLIPGTRLHCCDYCQLYLSENQKPKQNIGNPVLLGWPLPTWTVNEALCESSVLRALVGSCHCHLSALIFAKDVPKPRVLNWAHLSLSFTAL